MITTQFALTAQNKGHNFHILYVRLGSPVMPRGRYGYTRWVGMGLSTPLDGVALPWSHRTGPAPTHSRSTRFRSLDCAEREGCSARLGPTRSSGQPLSAVGCVFTKDHHKCPLSRTSHNSDLTRLRLLWTPCNTAWTIFTRPVTSGPFFSERTSLPRGISAEPSINRKTTTTPYSSNQTGFGDSRENSRRSISRLQLAGEPQGSIFLDCTFSGNMT